MLNFSYRFKRYESEYFSTLHIRIKSDITFYLLPITKTYKATTFCLTQMLQPHTFLLLTHIDCLNFLCLHQELVQNLPKCMGTI